MNNTDDISSKGGDSINTEEKMKQEGKMSSGDLMKYVILKIIEEAILILPPKDQLVS